MAAAPVDEEAPPATHIGEISSAVLAQIISDPEEFNRMMSTYGNVIEKKAGSIVLKLLIKTLGQIDKLRSDYTDGTLQLKISEYIRNHLPDLKDADCPFVDIDEGRLADVSMYLSSGDYRTLLNGIVFHVICVQAS